MWDTQSKYLAQTFSGISIIQLCRTQNVQGNPEIMLVNIVLKHLHAAVIIWDM